MSTILIANSGAPANWRVYSDGGDHYVFDEIDTLDDAFRHSGMAPLYTDVVWVQLPSDPDAVDYFRSFNPVVMDEIFQTILKHLPEDSHDD